MNIKSMLNRAFGVVILLILASSVGLAATPEEEVKEAFNGFITAFSSLDWEHFHVYFAEDATVFFPPSSGVMQRVDGKANIESVFQNVFESARRKQNPSIGIEPKDVEIKMLGPQAAIVSFHLEDPGVFGRRTIIFQKRNAKWLIVHMHASGIIMGKPAQTQQK